MSPQNTPFNSHYAETLRDCLKQEIDNLLNRMHAVTVLQFGYNGETYDVDYQEFWDMVDEFQEECRDNFLRVSDEKMARRYGFLLDRYFSFIPDKINEVQSELSDLISFSDSTGENEDKSVGTEAAQNYYGELEGLVIYMHWKLLPFVKRTVEECQIYFTEGLSTVNEAVKEQLAQPLPVTEQQASSYEPLHKLTWSCKPAVAGYIISELIRAGYVSPPTTNGELSLTKLAKICEQLFDIAGHNPSQGSWRNVLDAERNALSDTKRARLNLPDSDQLL